MRESPKIQKTHLLYKKVRESKLIVQKSKKLIYHVKNSKKKKFKRFINLKIFIWGVSNLL